MRTLVLLFGAGLQAGVLPAQSTPWQPAPGHAQIALWPGPPPDALASTGPEEMRVVNEEPVAGKPWILVGRVSVPTITVYSPTGKNSGAAVLVFPGGGYQILAIDLEGTEVCDWLTAKGITCVLLKYRVPGELQLPKSGAYPRSPLALQDALRAIRIVRHRAAEWRIDPHRIGVLGFSAGGHLVAAVSTLYDRPLYPAVDAADRESARPDFAVALYPGHLREHTKKPHQLNPFVPVTRETPPTFLLQAIDDPVDTVENARVYHAALVRAGVPVELHLFPHGGHAFGLRRTKQPITEWPVLVERWLERVGMIEQ